MKLPHINPANVDRIRRLADIINSRSKVDISHDLAALSDDERDHLLSLTRSAGRAAHIIPRRKTA